MGKFMMAAASLAAMCAFATAGHAAPDMKEAKHGAAMTPTDMTPDERGPFVAMAGASDLYEIESSRLALDKAQRPETREFAQMLIDHHSKTTQDVTAAARAAGMNPPPPRLMPMQSEMMAALRRASAKNFDSLYWKQQVPAHEMALAMHKNYSENGDTPELKSVAAGAVPIVQSHLDRAKAMTAK